MPRADLSNYLVHWIKAPSYDEAFSVLYKIVNERRLLAGTGHIKGGYGCVCFTEAPQSSFHQVLGRYMPFGIRVSKKWLYAQGGRPVIYQSEEEYENLHENCRWRHVRYEPNLDQPVDFSWEREWRICKADLTLPPGETSILVPHESWVTVLINAHNANEEQRIQFEAMAYGDEWARWEQPRPFRYAYSVIDLR